MKGMKEVMCCEHVKGRFFDTHKSKFKNYKQNRSLMNDDFEYYTCCSLLLLVADRDDEKVEGHLQRGAHGGTF